MAINLHFFRSNDLEKIDFLKVFDFFEEYPNFKIYYGPETVEIAYTDEDFKFYYRYLVTKKSRVNMIYKLNPAYTNCNFLLAQCSTITAHLLPAVQNVPKAVHG